MREILGSRWRNRFSGDEETVSRVGPCENLGGAIRVWFAEQEARWPSNGWAPDEFNRCWERVSAPSHTDAGGDDASRA